MTAPEVHAHEGHESHEGVVRCSWAEASQSERLYHDGEWGVPLRNERMLFELLCLESMQAGLSWRTVLEKREGYRRAFHHFDIARVADMEDGELTALLGDSGIIRNRRKIWAIRANARAALAVKEQQNLVDYLWRHVGGCPVQNAWRSVADVPSTTEASERMSRDLKRDHFKFVGPTTCYAFMQSSGMVNDHLVGCYRHGEVQGAVRN